MKKAFKKFFVVIAPLFVVVAFVGACASTAPCNNDSCYERNLSSADPYREGEIAAWGSEKEQAKRDEEYTKRAPQPKLRELNSR